MWFRLSQKLQLEAAQAGQQSHEPQTSSLRLVRLKPYSKPRNLGYPKLQNLRLCTLTPRSRKPKDATKWGPTGANLAPKTFLSLAMRCPCRDTSKRCSGWRMTEESSVQGVNVLGKKGSCKGSYKDYYKGSIRVPIRIIIRDP